MAAATLLQGGPLFFHGQEGQIDLPQRGRPCWLAARHGCCSQPLLAAGEAQPQGVVVRRQVVQGLSQEVGGHGALHGEQQGLVEVVGLPAGRARRTSAGWASGARRR